MKFSLLAALCSAALAGCASTMADTGRNVQEHIHQIAPAAQLRSLRVQNVSGSITIAARPGTNAVIDAVKYAGHQDAVDNTDVIVDRSPGSIDVHTHYAKSGFFGTRVAAVDFTIAVPPQTSIHLENVSGPVTVSGMAGNVEIQQVSGDVNAALGRVAGDRTVHVNTISGATTIGIAPNSDVTIDVKTVSGGVHGFFAMNTDKGFVGQSVHGRVGNGMATLDVNSVSGGVTINRQ